jgi:hypothetical protein
MTDWWLLALLTYPTIGLLFYAVCLLMLSSHTLRAIDARYDPCPLWMLLVVAALFWPFCIQKAFRKSRR